MSRSAQKKKHKKRNILSHAKKHIFLSVVISGIIIAVLTTFVFLPLYEHITASNGKAVKPIVKHHSQPVCGTPGAHAARCTAHVVTNDSLVPQASSTPPFAALGPVQLHTAYNQPCTPGGPVASVCNQPSSFGPVVAIVDAFHTPTIENDLNVFSTQYGLPSCTESNGCLQIVDENGGGSLPTSIDQSWSLEASLDVQTVHAMCQTCKILLVETNSNSYQDLATGVNTAAKMGAVAISNSYGGSEYQSETTYDSLYNHQGVAVIASSGDWGYGVYYPAASSNVISVGGTTLQLYSDNTYAGESVWSSSGSGCSAYENALSAQTTTTNWSQTGCGTKRGVADIAADADPNTGVAVYDSTPYNSQVGWWQVGGTSLSSPLVAAEFALANNTTVPAGTQVASLLYQNYNTSNFHDITSGSDGSCGSIMCSGTAGYDGPTGLGSLLGVGGFGGLMLPTPTSTPSSTPTPAPTNVPTATPTPTPTPVPTYSISGTAFLDNNKNGVQDFGESAFSNQVISLDPPAQPGQMTDANGYYSFKNLPAGTYTVTLVLASTSGYIPTTSNPVSIAVGPNQTVNFGVYPPQQPYISNVKVSTISTTGAYITYTTSAPGTTGLTYGFKKADYSKYSGPYSSNMVTSHAISFTGLQKNTTYYFKVYSQDGPYMQYSSVYSFKTLLR